MEAYLLIMPISMIIIFIVICTIFTPLMDHFRRDWRAPRPWIFGEFCDADDYRDLAPQLLSILVVNYLGGTLNRIRSMT